MFSVIGLRPNGDRVVITKDTDRKTAEIIVSLMTGGRMFGEVLIEADGDAETPSVGCGVSAFDDLAPAALTHGK
jgi:hypothetical protein